MKKKKKVTLNLYEKFAKFLWSCILKKSLDVTNAGNSSTFNFFISKAKTFDNLEMLVTKQWFFCIGINLFISTKNSVLLLPHLFVYYLIKHPSGKKASVVTDV